MFALLCVAEHYRAQQSRQTPFSHVGSVPEVCRFLFKVCLVAAIVIQAEGADVAEKKGEN